MSKKFDNVSGLSIGNLKIYYSFSIFGSESYDYRVAYEFNTTRAELFTLQNSCDPPKAVTYSNGEIAILFFLIPARIIRKCHDFFFFYNSFYKIYIKTDAYFSLSHRSRSAVFRELRYVDRVRVCMNYLCVSSVCSYMVYIYIYTYTCFSDLLRYGKKQTLLLCSTYKEKKK